MRPRAKTLRHTWRRRLFWLWVAASALVGTYVGIAGPFVSYFGEGQPIVALALPALMIFLLATGLGWLVLFVLSRPRHDRTAR
jgi:hypothetical protein